MEYKNGKIHDVALLPLKKFLDDRGYLVEIFRSDNLPEGLMPEMAYVSFTEPEVGRGPHEHESQTDIFTFIGPGNFKVYLWDARPDSETYGNRHVFYAGTDNPMTVTVPPGVVHGYKNISKTERGMVINGPDKLYAGKDKKEKVDEIRHEQEQDQFFKEFESL